MMITSKQGVVYTACFSSNFIYFDMELEKNLLNQRRQDDDVDINDDYPSPTTSHAGGLVWVPDSDTLTAFLSN